MAAPALRKAFFLERPNRFGAWVDLDGNREYAHLPDPGRLRELLLPGRPVWLREHATAGRKTRYSLVMTQEHGNWVSLDTGLPTAAVRQALAEGRLPEFAAYDRVKPEFRYGRSRLDFSLSHSQEQSAPAAASRPCLLEVKSVTLVVDGLGLFPDAVSERASRHVRELMFAASEGYRAAVLFVVQRQDASAVAANRETDPKFASALTEAALAGVELYARICRVSPDGVALANSVPVLTPPPASPQHK